MGAQSAQKNVSQQEKEREREGERARAGECKPFKSQKFSYLLFTTILLWRVEAFTFYDCTAIAEAAGGGSR